jgi:hypothetical protein
MRTVLGSQRTTNWLVFSIGVAYAFVGPLGFLLAFTGGFDASWYGAVVSSFFNVWAYPLILLPRTLVSNSPWVLPLLLLYLALPDVLVAFVLFRRKSRGLAKAISALTVIYVLVDFALVIFFLGVVNCGVSC